MHFECMIQLEKTNERKLDNLVFIYCLKNDNSIVFFVEYISHETMLFSSLEHLLIVNEDQTIYGLF
jgi:hypothetical protein